MSLLNVKENPDDAIPLEICFFGSSVRGEKRETEKGLYYPDGRNFCSINDRCAHQIKVIGSEPVHSDTICKYEKSEIKANQHHLPSVHSSL